MLKPRLLILAVIAATVLAGCGSAGEEPAKLGADGRATISGDNFAEWQTAAAAAPGLKCTHARMVYPDTGEGVAEPGDVSKIKSTQTPSFQCVRLPRSAWAFEAKDAAEAKARSDAATVAKTAPDVRVVDPPKSAPDGASCIEYKKQKRFTCYVAWRNLALMSDSLTSLDEAGELLTGTLATVEKVFEG